MTKKLTPARKLVPTSELGKHLFLTRSRIADLKSNGVLIPEKGVTARGRGGGNLFDIDMSRERYIKYLRKMKAIERGKLNAGTPKKTGSTYVSGYGYDEKLKEEQWREKKRKNDIAENDVIPLHVIQYALMRVASKLSTIIERIVPNIKRLWPETDEELMEIIQKSIDTALIEAANIKLSEKELTTEEEVSL